MITAKNRGVILVFLTAITIGLGPVLVHAGVQSVPPLALAFVTHACALVGAILYGLYEGSIKELFNLKYLGRLFLIALTIIVIPLSLFYVGASLTSGVNTSVLTLSEIVFTIILAHFFLGEIVTIYKILGAAGILIGSLLFLYHSGETWRIGDFIIVFSTITYPIGNFLQKKILTEISPASLLIGRLALAVPVLWIFFVLSNEVVSWKLVWQNHWLVILTIGLVNAALGKIWWFKGLKTLDITTAVSLIMTYPLFSVLFLWISNAETITSRHILGISIMMTGVYCTLRPNSKKLSPQTV